MLIATKGTSEVNKLKTLLSREFDMNDLGAGKKILRMERFNPKNAKHVSTPLAHNFKWSTTLCPKIDDEVEDMSKVPDASAAGCFMYAMVCTRLDLAQVVSAVIKFLLNLGRSHIGIQSSVPPDT